LPSSPATLTAGTMATSPTTTTTTAPILPKSRLQLARPAHRRPLRARPPQRAIKRRWRPPATKFLELTAYSSRTLARPRAARFPRSPTRRCPAKSPQVVARLTLPRADLLASI
jgi:hypothetical protein